MSRLPSRLARALALNKGRTPALAIPGSDFALAVVQTVYTDGTVDVTFDGGATTTNIQAMSNFLPVAGQTVLCAVFGTTIYILGTPGAYPGVPSAWVSVGATGAPALGGGVVNLGGPWQVVQFRLVGDMVQIRGLWQCGTAPTYTIFVLPVGYRPPAQITFVVDGGEAFGRVDVYPSGSVFFVSGSTASYGSFGAGVQFSTTA